MPDIGVLLVEDERLLDRVVADALRTLGLSCDAAQSEDEAIRRLQERHYDLMILDLRLQGGSGITVLQQARRLYPDLPVVLVTAYAITDEVQAALAWGIDALLYKPFDIDTLLATVRALLHRRLRPVPTHAVVRLESSPAAPVVRRGGVLEVGELATLKSEACALVCRVRQLDEGWLSVETERVEPPVRNHWQMEWTGDDALYQFSTRVIEYLPQDYVALWLLRQPTVIRRIQRRRYPRVPVSGRAFVSLTGRLQRATEANLIDLSEAGACVVLLEPPLRGAQAHLEVHAETEAGTITFQREGVVRSIVAFVEGGQPRYRVGLQLERLPARALKQLRQLRRERLIHP
ncbi:MAG: response regulator [Fimbriimonadales bacterium]|nr:response regulator [Fimbriimonadales bacterium]